jgi:hypothetical protein
MSADDDREEDSVPPPAKPKAKVAEKPAPASKPAPVEADPEDEDDDESAEDEDDDDGEEAAASEKPRRGAPARQAAKTANESSRFALWIVALVAVVGAVAGGIYLYSRNKAVVAPVGDQAQTSLGAIPHNAMVIVSVDMKALRASPLAAPYLGGERSVPGLGTIKETCGFDPILLVDEITVGVPEAGDTDFGIAAMGSFTDESMIDCATKVIGGRGGKPVTSPIGKFRTVRDLDAPGVGEIAARPGGLLLLGGGPYLRSMIDAADGAVPSSAADARHTELRTALAGFETLRGTMVLSNQQRAMMAEEIKKTGGRAPTALGSIRGAALGARLVDKQASLLAIVRTDGASQAISIAGLLEESKNDARSGVTAQILGLAPLLDRVKISVEGSDVRATLEVSIAELEDVIEKAIQVRALLDAKPSEPTPEEAPPAPSSDKPIESAPPPPSSSARVAPPAQSAAPR